jgi:hypothetical protein
MRDIYYETKDTNHALNLHYIKTEKGFDHSYIDDIDWSMGYKFSNNDNCRCNYYSFGEKKKEPVISITVDDISSSGWYGTTGMLYRCMDELNKIAEEFRKFRSDWEKKEKINGIAKNSIYTWLETILQNQPYLYYTNEDNNKIMLSIKIKYRMQLDIPIYFNRFQKIIPELLETIQEFEKTSNKSKIKVLISNSRPNQEWKGKK